MTGDGMSCVAYTPAKWPTTDKTYYICGWVLSMYVDVYIIIIIIFKTKYEQDTADQRPETKDQRPEHK